jgi:hypothetical protein
VGVRGVEGLTGEVVVSLDGGGAREGSEVGTNFGGVAELAKECKKAIDSCFLSRRGWVLVLLKLDKTRVYVPTHLVE